MRTLAPEADISCIPQNTEYRIPFHLIICSCLAEDIRDLVCRKPGYPVYSFKMLESCTKVKIRSRHTLILYALNRKCYFDEIRVTANTESYQIVPDQLAFSTVKKTKRFSGIVTAGGLFRI